MECNIIYIWVTYCREEVCHMDEGKLTTKQLFDAFFAEKDEEVTRKTRTQVDRPEVYAFEKKIGKQLVEMDIEELFQMILSFDGNRNYKNSSFKIGYSSYDQIASMYRSIFNYYIDNVKPIKNPFNDKRMKGMEAAKRLSQNKEPFSIDIVNDVIKKMHNDIDTNHANYYECIMLLYYNGFAKGEEIALLDEDMISPKDKTVRLPGRTIQLSDRCFELLEFVHNMEDIEGWRGNLVMATWQGHYFKYIVREKGVQKLQERPVGEIANVINRAIVVNVKNKYKVDVGYRILYLLGFYDFMVNKFGKDRVRELITSVRNPECTADLVGAARNYGVVVDNVSHLKKWLRPFISSE